MRLASAIVPSGDIVCLGVGGGRWGARPVFTLPPRALASSHWEVGGGCCELLPRKMGCFGRSLTHACSLDGVKIFFVVELFEG